jgi:hypothetical protein
MRHYNEMSHLWPDAPRRDNPMSITQALISLTYRDHAAADRRRSAEALRLAEQIEETKVAR